MPNQTQKGKAFEYACLKAFYNNLRAEQTVEIEETAATSVAKDFYDGFEDVFKNKLDKAAEAAFRIIIRLEPQLKNPDKNVPLYLSIQEDAMGIAGDVRDVLCIRKQNGWEIGFSCKHNHAAVKHSRLSYSIDFGKLWLDISCTDHYFVEIKPLFNMLVEAKQQGLKWSEIDDKATIVYRPLLDAFVAEIKRLDKRNPGKLPPVFLSYLLGKNDFYKIMTKDSKKITQIQAYNIFGTLNRQSGNIKAELSIQQLKLPTKLFDISYKPNSDNTIIVTCDNGWALSFRIHNASSDVEPSLKFDIQLVGVPQTLHTQIEPW